MFKFITNLFNRKNKLHITDVSNLVSCDGCNDYGYIVVTLGGKSCKMVCSKCDGESNSNSDEADC
jgi:hypothetical protein